MFGFRPDGRRVKLDDAILRLTPYLMPQRVDAQVHSVQRVDCDIMTRYIRDQRAKGHILSYIDLILAAYVRVASQNPEINRFVANKQLYARNTICVSMALLKTFDDDEKIQEATVKLHFSPYSTVYDVHHVIQQAIEENRKPEVANNTDKFARLLLMVPGFPTLVVAIARILDRYGVLPAWITEVSPFHTGLFFTSMASLGMPYVNHHIYNFGTTSIFLSMGKVERTPFPGPDGTVMFKRITPMGVVSDERITSGAGFARAFSLWRDLLANPSLLETPPETIQQDYPPEKMPGYRRKMRAERRKEKRERRQAQ